MPVDEITVAEVERKYPDEWVLLQITRDHRDHPRLTGRLLGHSPDRGALDDPYRRFRAETPSARVYEFFTGALVEEGVAAVL